jgi:3-oxoacyl-[acyl-carrier-protein] synthase-3
VALNLLGLGHFHPENEITNQFLEDLDIGTNDEWIMERTGIRSPRRLPRLHRTTATRSARASGAGSRMPRWVRGRRMALGAPIDVGDVGL